MRDHEQAFAIVRIDGFGGVVDTSSPRDREKLEIDVTVKRVVWSREVAEADVARLNALNADKNCHYFWQTTRVARREDASSSKDG